MSTIQELLSRASTSLFSITRDRNQAWLEAELLLGFVLKKDRIWIIAHAQERLTKHQEVALSSLCKRRLTHEPLAYIFGEVEFTGKIFTVSSATLIPRPESAQILEEIRPWANAADPSTILWDVGTGSGILGICAKIDFPKLQVIASDTSRAALHVARKNAVRLLKQSPRYFQADLFADQIKNHLKRSKPCSLLVLANLPYLPLSQKRILAPQVTKHEPLNALFAPKHGLALNQRLLTQLADWHQETKVPVHGVLEFDPDQQKALKTFTQSLFPIHKIKLDLYGRARFLVFSSDRLTR
jgi:release factor glutamine methyltransferase